MHFNVQRGYHTFLTKLCRFLLAKSCHAKREQANFKDPFAAAVTNGKLIIGHVLKNCRSLLDVPMMKWVNSLLSY